MWNGAREKSLPIFVSAWTIVDCPIIYFTHLASRTRRHAYMKPRFTVSGVEPYTRVEMIVMKIKVSKNKIRKSLNVCNERLVISKGSIFTLCVRFSRWKKINTSWSVHGRLQEKFKLLWNLRLYITNNYWIQYIYYRSIHVYTILVCEGENSRITLGVRGAGPLSEEQIHDRRIRSIVRGQVQGPRIRSKVRGWGPWFVDRV